MVTGPKKKLRAHINRALLVGAQMNRGIPIEAQSTFTVFLLRFNVAALQSAPVHPRDVAPLRFHVGVIFVSRIRECPKSISAVQILPTPVGNSPG